MLQRSHGIVDGRGKELMKVFCMVFITVNGHSPIFDHRNDGTLHGVRNGMIGMRHSTVDHF